MARRRGLSAEDEALWSRVAQSAVPLHPGRTSPPRPEPTELPHPPSFQPRPPPSPSLSLQDFRLGGRPLRPAATSLDLARHPGQALHEQPLRMDHKTHRRMKQGRLSPEARIDLHGMTLNVAQPQLLRFILNARAEGFRLVLVITGKGRETTAGAPLPVRPGALRHNVPLWLDMPPFDRLVQQVRPAHRRHGGEGAYYIYLRR